MKKSVLNMTGIVGLAGCSFLAFANEGIELGWQALQAKTAINAQSRVSSGAMMRLSEGQLAILLQTFDGNIELDVPLPNGQLVTFSLTPNSAMSPELARKFPSIRTFSGVQVDNPQNSGQFDVTPNGFHAMFSHDGQTVFVDPQQQGDRANYVSYYRKNAALGSASAPFKQYLPKKLIDSSLKDVAQTSDKHHRQKALQQIKTYRLAISAAAEYTAFFGGTKEAGLAAIVTMVNRLNQVYLQDMSLQFELVANNDAIVFTDANTDPFNNDGDDGSLNTGVINDAIGVDNYDLGHVVNTDGGGLAAFGVACDANYKGDGMTGDSNPVGDAFHIDYVAHEIGHQLRADHTFNGQQGACDGNRANDSSYEPGSASTIMGYAGICGEQNLQNNSDPFFHIHSIDQMSAFINSGDGASCGTTSNSSNNVPTVDAGNDYTIPALTPFVLTGQGSDTDSNATLSYSWEQFDLGPATATKSDDETDSGQGPLFRALSPTSEPVRYLPKLADVLLNQVSYGETYPATSRELNFRLIVRDALGGVADDAMKINVVDTGSAFAVTVPNGNEAYTTNPQNITWDVANTNIAPINCASVDIKMSTNNGQSFEHSLANGVANDGEHAVEYPEGNFPQSRVMVSCSDNIFYAMNKGTFTSNITGDVSYSIVGQQPISVNEDDSIELTKALFIISGDAVSIKVATGNNYTVDNTLVTPDANFNGELTVNVTAVFSDRESEPFPAKVSVNAVNDAPVLQNDSLSITQDTQNHTVDVLANDSDVDGDTLTIQSATTNASGTVSLSDNKLVYTPQSGFTGTETVNYVVTDGTVTANANLVVTVNAASGNSGNGNSSSSSSGGGLYYGVFLLLLAGVSRLFQRGMRQQKYLNVKGGNRNV
ncbi:reprolysin-like metallopeptidase [Thalassotalea fusca]